MALPGYGLLIGTVVASRPQQGASPHWLLFVKPKLEGHPAYRVAVNLDAKVQYQIVDLGKSPLVAVLRGLGPTDNFLTAEAHPEVPRLDFVRGGIVDPSAFVPIEAGTSPFRDAFADALAKLAKSKDALIAVFGTGSPIDAKTGLPPGTGFVGVDNIHMNQGTRHVTGGTDHYLENGANQDGGIVLLDRSGAKAFFCKFVGQSVDTDEDGRPNDTGIPKLDRTPATVRKAIAKARTDAAGPAMAAPPAGFIFADPDPDDAKQPYQADDDGTNRTAPFVVTRAKGRTRGPVPNPRGYPTLKLEDVVAATPGYTKTAAGETIAFDLVGDSGAPSEKKLSGELSVTELMVKTAKQQPPAFLFHLGDVVYFYGEEDFYYSQFYEPFQQYPAPIFAIPGNHDGITYTPEMVSLAPFQNAFCAAKPGPWVGSGAIQRSAMIQPGVYFTLDAPLVSIIGLYSNVGESLGWLDEPQTLFLYQELVRLKKLREKEGRAVILAIHHCPRWFPDMKDPTSAAIDAACEKAEFWPDAVVCGHAHLYQRIVRKQGKKEIPYLIAGAGGYGINALQVTARNYIKTIEPRLQRLLFEEGFVRATVTKPAKGKPILRFEYRSVKQTSDEPDDVWEVPLT